MATEQRAGSNGHEAPAVGPAGKPIELNDAWAKETADKARGFNALTEEAAGRYKEFENSLAETLVDKDGDEEFQDAGIDEPGRAAAPAEGSEVSTPPREGTAREQDSYAASCKRAVKAAEEGLATRTRLHLKAAHGGAQRG